MNLGQPVITKYNGEIKKFNVVKLIGNEDLELCDGEITIVRKYWEVNKAD